MGWSFYNSNGEVLVSDNIAGQADQADAEAESDVNKYLPPDLVKHIPGVAKGWILFVGTGTVSISASYNVTSITDNGTGNYTITWATDFSSADYAAPAVAAHQSAVGWRDIAESESGSNRTATRVDYLVADASDTLADTPFVHVAAFGDQ